MNIIEALRKKRLFFDGGTGTYLQEKGLLPGESPEKWCISKPWIITELHKLYFEAGSDVVSTNTFGVNASKFENYEEIIGCAVSCAKKARDGFKDKYIAFDMGPTGRMLKPYGDLEFEECVELFAKNVRCAVKHGVDLIIIETMNDALETKAAVIAAKENSSLPVFVTNVYDRKRKLMTGADAKAMIAMLEGLGVDALGMNCSFGPEQMLEIIDEFAKYSSTPIIVNPNAGLPKIKDNKTYFDLSPEDFAKSCAQLAERGATILGGCCGTTPEYIKKTVEAVKDIPYTLPSQKNFTVVSSYTHAVHSDEKCVLIGERINPTGKKKLKEAIKALDINYILSEGLNQAQYVDILDVNMGVPGIDEPAVMQRVVKELQAVTDIPLQIDSSDKDALERAVRIYAGKPMINSVNGKKESMQEVFPIVKKYGGVLIGLTLDENGIPDTAKGRVEIALRIIQEAQKYGIQKKDIVIDPLALTVSSDKNSAIITLEAIRLLNEMGIKTSLGVSNISFGLPVRDIINSSFFTLALQKGLNFAIMNPFSVAMMNSYHAYNVLCGLDDGCSEYISYSSGIDMGESTLGSAALNNAQKDTCASSLSDAIVKGLSQPAALLCKQHIDSGLSALDTINDHIIPALNLIGDAFEKGKAYLPQLLMSAEAASEAFAVVKEKIGKSAVNQNKKVVLATVKGDIHDIGKNIVKVLLESYGFNVIDLGKDVAPEDICLCARKEKCCLIGLSALMTTTVASMEKTITLLKEQNQDIKVVVGGAVLNSEYAKQINADFYAKDAMEMVRIAKQYYK